MVGRHDGVLRHRGPAGREEIIKGYEAQAAKVNNQYDLGLLTEEERRQELVDLLGQSAPTRSPKPCARTSMTTTT